MQSTLKDTLKEKESGMRRFRNFPDPIDEAIIETITDPSEFRTQEVPIEVTTTRARSVTTAVVSCHLDGHEMEGTGQSIRHPEDDDDISIGTTLAIGRAFMVLGEALLRRADNDITLRDEGQAGVLSFIIEKAANRMQEITDKAWADVEACFCDAEVFMSEGRDDEHECGS